MPAVKTLKKIPVYVWIPPSFSPVFKIEVVKSDSTAVDVSDIIYEGEYTDGITDTIGNFTFTIDNSKEDYTGIFSLYDEVNIYLDYGTDATTLRYKGVIEKISQRGEKLIAIGRSVSARLMGTTVTQRYADQYTHDILINLLSKYATYITQTNIDITDATDTQITVNWYQRPFWECVLELCNRAGYDAYVDSGSDFNYFVQGSRLNSDECVVHDSNLIDTGDFAPDLSVVKNRIIVYGAKVEEQQVIWTASDSTSIASYDIKEEIINDTSCITVTQAEARANFELALKKDPPIVGEVTSLGLPTLMPGQQVKISDPMSNLQPAYYTIAKFTHKFSNDEPLQTILTVAKEINTLPKILKKRLTFEVQAVDMENPNEMKYSFINDFNTDTGVHSNTKITAGRLIISGSAPGTWISGLPDSTQLATSCELRVKGEALPGTTYGTTYFVSVNNGVSFQQIPTLNSVVTLTPPGSYIKLNIVLKSDSTQIDSCVLLYK